MWRYLLIGAAVFTASAAFAQSEISFPIAELGGCDSKESCKAYCDNSANSEACLSFAEKNNLMTAEETAMARKFLNERPKIRDNVGRPDVKVPEPNLNKERVEKILAEKGGPGGCKSHEECKTYCGDETNIGTCLAFAKENELMSQEELARAEKFATQTGPGGCKGVQCKAYCEDESRAGECVAFAKENGFISQEEAGRAEKLLNTTGPGGCRCSSCRSYCEDRSHRDECFEFAKQNDLISPEELQRIEQFKEMMTQRERREREMQQSERRDSFPGEGEPRYMGNEQFREEGGMQPPPATERREREEEMRPMPPTEGSSGQFEQEYNRQYKEQYKRQYDQEYQKQYKEERQRQYEQQRRPEGAGVPTEASRQPDVRPAEIPTEFVQPLPTAPPSIETAPSDAGAPAPAAPTEPSSFSPIQMAASALNAFLAFFAGSGESF